MSKNYRKITFIIIILLVISYIYYTFPRKLIKTYKGIEYRLGNSEYEEVVEIKVDGWYTRKLSGDEFKGKFIINDEKILKTKLKLKENKDWMLAIDLENGEAISFGIIYKKGKFDEITICKYETDEKSGGSHWNGAHGLMISAPANNRSEALELSNKLMKKLLNERDFKLK